MLERIKSITYKNLQRLSATKRVQAMQDPNTSQVVFSLLTPTQLTELFPKYYQKQLPDISGFMKALPSSYFAAKQKIFEDAMRKTKPGREGAVLEGWDPNMRTGIDKGRAHISTGGKDQTAQMLKLNDEQTAAYNKIQQGSVDINSPEAKMFSGLSKEKLASAGLEVVEDPTTHQKLMRYNQPEVSREEAVSRLQTGGEETGSSPAAKAAAEKYLGRSMTEGEWDWVVRTTAAEATSHKGETAMVMASILNRARSGKYGGNSIEGVVSAPKQFSSYTNRTAFRDPGAARRNSIYSSASMLNGISHNQTDFASANPRAYDKEGGRGEQKIAERLNKGFTRVGGQYFNAASQSTLAEGPPVKPEGPNHQYSDQQIAKMQEQLKTEKNDARRQQLANVLGDIQGTPQYAQVHGGQMATAAATGGAPVTYGQTKDFSGYALHQGVDNFQGRCGEGARKMAGHMYGHAAFINEGLGGDGTAGSLSHGNNYFQRSGLFNEAKSVGRDQLKSQEYLNSLPIGTVISASGGKAGGNNGQGHVQIKIGPDKWASDTVQSHVLTNGSHGNLYDNYKVHVPNETGLARLRDNGVNQNVSVAAAASPASYTPTKGGEAPAPSRQIDTPDQPLDFQGARTTAGSAPEMMQAAMGGMPFNPLQAIQGFSEDPISTIMSLITQVLGAPSATAAPMQAPTGGEAPAPQPQTADVSASPPAQTPAPAAQQQAPAPTTPAAATTPDQQAQPPAAPTQPKQQAPAPAKQTATPAPVEAPPVEKVSPNSYKVNQAGFVNAIRATPEFKSQAGMFGSMVPDDTILNGFNNDPQVKAAGAYYDIKTNTMHFKDPNNPKVKEVMSGFDTKSFMTPIEQPVVKPETKKPDIKTQSKVENPDMKPQQTAQANVDLPPTPEVTKTTKAMSQQVDKNNELDVATPTAVNQLRQEFANPSSRRAFSRARFAETGDAINDFHHSIGNAQMA